MSTAFSASESLATSWADQLGLEHPFDGSQQLARADRLQQKLEAVEIILRDDEGRDAFLSGSVGHLDAAAIRQPQVRYHEVERVGSEQYETGYHPPGGLDRVAAIDQSMFHDMAHVQVVFD